jgi:hypothetical protein
VHAGNFAVAAPGTIFDTYLGSPLTEELYVNFGLFANPAAMINRVDFNGLRAIYTLADWESTVNEELEKPNEVNLRLSNTWYPELKVVVVDVETEFVTEPEGNYKLAVYIVEDSIVSPQLNNNLEIFPDDTLVDYVHRNLLRDAISPNYGDFLGDAGQVATGEIYTKQYTYPVNETWITQNCRIIAYIGKQNETFSMADLVQVAELEIKVDEE